MSNKQTSVESDASIIITRYKAQHIFTFQIKKFINKVHIVVTHLFSITEMSIGGPSFEGSQTLYTKIDFLNNDSTRID